MNKVLYEDFYNKVISPLDNENIISELYENFKKGDISSSRIWSTTDYNNTPSESDFRFYSGNYCIYKMLIKACRINEQDIKKIENLYKEKIDIKDINYIQRFFLNEIKLIKAGKIIYDDLFVDYFESNQIKRLEKYCKFNNLNFENLEKLYVKIEAIFNIMNFNDWIRVNSYRYEKAQPIFHRFYLNIKDNIVIDNFALNFIKKCELKDIKCNFKYTNVDCSSDSIVFYCSNDDLINYYTMLKEILEEHPEYKKYIFEPPKLTGVIDGVIGYGSETSLKDQYDKRSYNVYRGNVFDDVLQNLKRKNSNITDIKVFKKLLLEEMKNYIISYKEDIDIENIAFSKDYKELIK